MDVKGRITTRDEWVEELVEDQVITKGGQNRFIVSDQDVYELLGQILNELKTMNLHLQAMTDEEFNNAN
jgi:hypothetical protein